MIESLDVRDFRGIDLLEVRDLGRVNLFVGRNGAGKTAAMEAIWIGASKAHLEAAFLMQLARGLDSAEATFWHSLFRNQDPSAGCAVTVGSSGSADSVRIVDPDPLSAPGTQGVVWRVEGAVSAAGVESHTETAWNSAATSQSSAMTQPAGPRFSHRAKGSSVWIRPGPDLTPTDLAAFSHIKQQSKDDALLQMLRAVLPSIKGIELLSPTGTRGRIFVRLADGQVLPLAVMGDGLQRCFEFAIHLVGAVAQQVFIDEVENGLHHSILGPVWRGIAAMSRVSNAQVFCSTHSDECIQAAVDEFRQADDDGLRIVRLDRRGDRTTAAVYPRDLAEHAGAHAIEIRG